MARTNIAPVAPFDMRDDISANDADLSWTACTGASGSSGNYTTLTGREIILVRNTDAVNPYTVTFSSAADSKLKRTKDITAYSIGAGEVAAFVPYQLDGWQQDAAGTLNFEGENAALEFCILRPKQLL